MSNARALVEKRLKYALESVALTSEGSKSWYWTGKTVINSVVRGDVDGDGSEEIVTGGITFGGAQLCVWNGAKLGLENVKTWYWAGNTYIRSVVLPTLMVMAVWRLLQAVTSMMELVTLLSCVFGNPGWSLIISKPGTGRAIQSSIQLHLSTLTVITARRL